MSQKTTLTFINKSAASEGTRVVFFQQTPATGPELALAWKVIAQPAPDIRYTFEVPVEYRQAIAVSALTGAQPGEVLTDLTPHATPLQFGLPNITSATLTMHGGADAPLTFTLDDVVRR